MNKYIIDNNIKVKPRHQMLSQNKSHIQNHHMSPHTKMFNINRTTSVPNRCHKVKGYVPNMKRLGQS